MGKFYRTDQPVAEGWGVAMRSARMKQMQIIGPQYRIHSHWAEQMTPLHSLDKQDSPKVQPLRFL